MTWVGFAILAGLFSQVFNFFNRYVLRDGGDATAYGWWFLVIKGSLFLAALSFDRRFEFGWGNLVVLGMLGVTEFFSVYFFMKMHAFADLSLSSIVVRLRLVWVAIAAWLFLGERLVWKEYLGIVVIVLGMMIAVSPKKIKTDKGAWYALASSVVLAILAILMKKGAMFASTAVVGLGMCFFPLVMLPVAMKSPGQRIKAASKNLKWNLVATVCNVGAMYLVLEALRRGATGKVMAVYQGMMVMAVAAGIGFLKEREEVVRRLLGTLVTMAGILMVV